MVKQRLIIKENLEMYHSAIIDTKNEILLIKRYDRDREHTSGDPT